MAQRGFLVIDANVLVDYQAADLAILALVNRHVGTVRILTTMLEEVEGLDESDCERLGFRVVEPTFVQVTEAASQSGRLSFQDRTCLVVCRDRGWTCVSNDRALRRACEADGIGVIWGSSSCWSSFGTVVCSLKMRPKPPSGSTWRTPST